MKIPSLRNCAFFTVLAFIMFPINAYTQNNAPTRSAPPEDLQITIYGNNRALITDTRHFNFQKGAQVLLWPQISSKIEPTSANLNTQHTKIIEQNFDYDLLTPAKLMQKSVGKVIEIVRINPTTNKHVKENARVLATNNGVVIDVNGRIEILRDDKLPTRVIFKEIPKNLRASPTLSMRIDSSKSSKRPATLSYLSKDISWAADYVALFDEKASTMTLQAWASIGNYTDTVFENARLYLIAGTIGTQNNRRPSRQHNSTPRAGTQKTPQERIGDVYLYTLPGRTNLASKQTKQISFHEASNIRAKKVYAYHTGELTSFQSPANVDVRLNFSNDKANGLGANLPKGVMRIYAKDAKGNTQFIGEDTIPHTVAGSDLSLKIGQAFDINIMGKIVSKTSVRNTEKTRMQYTLTNAQNTPQTVNVKQNTRHWYRNVNVKNTSHKARKINAHTWEWDIAIPANGEAVLTFDVVIKNNPHQ